MRLVMSEHSNSREVRDPANRKTNTWQLKFARGSARHIMCKHVKNKNEPWGEAIEQDLLSIIRSHRSSPMETQALKDSLFDHAELACKRPQALSYDEIRELHASESVRCCLLVCRCGLMIAIRQVDTQPSIHTAFFRQGTAHVFAPERWKKLVRYLRNEHVVADSTSGKLTYPAPDVYKEVEDTEDPASKYWRAGIEFHTKHTWGFKEQDGSWHPLGEIPAWQEAMR